MHKFGSILSFQIIWMRASKVNNDKAKQLDNNEGFHHSNQLIDLESPPQIVIKKSEPTNYEIVGKWYISPAMLVVSLHKLIISSQNMTGDQNADHFAIANILRRAAELNKLTTDPTVGLYINLNLSVSYHNLLSLNMEIASLQKSSRMLSEQGKGDSFKFIEIVPSNYFSESSNFYEVMANRYRLHLLRGRVRLALSARYENSGSFSSNSQKLKLGYNTALEALSDFRKCLHQLAVVYFGKMLKFIMRNRAKRMRVKRMKKGEAIDAHNLVDIQFQNYQVCLGTLHCICVHQQKEADLHQIKPLRDIIANQTKAINSVLQSNSFLQTVEDSEDYISKQLKSSNHSQFLTLSYFPLAALELKGPLQSIIVQIEEVLQIAALLTASTFALSQISRSLQESNASTTQKMEVKFSEHWLSRSLEISHQHLSSTVLYEQIKKTFDSSHGISHEVIQQQQQQLQQQKNEPSQLGDRNASKAHWTKDGNALNSNNNPSNATNCSHTCKQEVQKQDVQIEECVNLMKSVNRFSTHRAMNIVQNRQEDKKHQTARDSDFYEIATLRTKNLAPIVVRKLKVEKLFHQKQRAGRRNRIQVTRSLEWPDSQGINSRKSKSIRIKLKQTSIDALSKVYDFDARVNEGAQARKKTASLSSSRRRREEESSKDMRDKKNNECQLSPGISLNYKRYNFKNVAKMGSGEYFEDETPPMFNKLTKQ